MVALNREVLFLPEELLGSPTTLLSILMIIAGIVTAGALSIIFLNRKERKQVKSSLRTPGGIMLPLPVQKDD